MKSPEEPPKHLSKVMVIFSVVLVIALAWISYPAIKNARKAAARARTTGNLKEIGSALLGFVDQYESYPCEATRQMLIRDGATVVPIGTDANSYLGQLLAAGSVDSELIFYVRGMEGMSKGDSQFDTPAKILEKGENGLGYVMLKGDKPLVKPGSIVPVVVAPLKSGGSDPVFDTAPFRGQYIYLTPDGVVSGGKISKDGRPIAKGRGVGGLFAVGKDSIFEEEVPDVKAPRGL